MLDRRNGCSQISTSQAAPTVESKSHASQLTLNTQMPLPSPSRTCHPNLDKRDERIQTKGLLLPVRGRSEVRDQYGHRHRPSSNELGVSSYDCSSGSRASLLPLPDVPMVDNKQWPSSTMCCSNSTSFLTTPTSPLSILWGPEPWEASATSPNSEMESESKLPQRLGMEGFEKSPMAQLMQKYSLAAIESQLGLMEISIMWVLSLEELTLDHIVDRGEDRNRRLPRYHLGKATMDNFCSVVTAQQIFLQQAAALIVERKSHFIVDPGNTLIPILEGTSSLPQLYAAWKALITRIKLGVKAWEKYIAEYQLQADVVVLSPLSTLSC